MVSIVLPCLDEEAHIERAVRAAMGQHYPPSRLEILVCDGGSADGTRTIVDRLAGEDPRVRLVHNPGRYPSAGLNQGIRRARGQVIVRMDAHAEYAPDYVACGVDALRRTGAAVAGGAARALANAPFQRAVVAALSSPLGVGGSAYRDPSREGFVESVWGGAFRREVFEVVGLFDAEARANEDAELNQRVIEAGGKVFLSRDLVSYYYPRRALSDLADQYFTYGVGRARTLLARRRALSARPFVPFAAVTLGTLLILLALIVPSLWLVPVIAGLLYLALVLAESARVARVHGRGALIRLPFIFPAMHAAHGLGVWSGLLRHVGTGLADREPDRLLAR